MHEYLRRLIKAAQQGTFRPGKIYMAFIAHDRDCPFFKGQPCQCNPEITIAPYEPGETTQGEAKHEN